MAFLVIDSVEVPVLEGSWEESFVVPGSHGRTETGVLRVVRRGNQRSEYKGQSLFTSRTAANALVSLLNAVGDREVSGDGPARTVTCISEATIAEALPHRPKSGPTAAWRVRWRLIEAP